MQPGEYIFYGGTHVGPGVCGLADCALSIRATIASLPTPGRAVLDAGSKVLSGDIKPSLMPNLRLEGMGIVRDGDSLKPLEGAVLTTLSEEHGVIEYDPGCGLELNLGQVVDVVPVHVCTAVNLATALVAVRDGVVAEGVAGRRERLRLVDRMGGGETGCSITSFVAAASLMVPGRPGSAATSPLRAGG